MRRSAFWSRRRRAGVDARTLVVAVIAFAAGLLILRGGAGLWAGQVAAWMERSASEGPIAEAEWQAVEPAELSMEGVDLGTGFGE